MQSIKRAAVAASVAILAACGGGGGDDAPAAAQQVAPTMRGTMGSVAGSVNPDPAATAQPLRVQFTAQFTGSFSPAASSFTVPFNVTRDGAQHATGTATFTMTTGQPGQGTFDGTAGLNLPADSAGTHVYCVRLNPGASYTWSGTLEEAQCTSITVTP